MWNVPTISSLLRSLITYVHGTVFLTFFNHKNFLRTIWIIIVCKMFLYFYILTWSPILNLGSLLLTSIVKTCVWFYINRFHLNCAYISQLYHLMYQYIFFFKLKLCISKFNSFKALINLSVSTDFTSLCFEYISIAFFLTKISLIYYKICCFYVSISCLVCF